MLMQFRIFGSVVVLAVVLTACDSSKEANRGNFAKAIDAQIAKKCVTVSFRMSMTETSTFPVSIRLAQTGRLVSVDQAKQANERALAPYETLVHVGLLTGSDAQVDSGFNSKIPGRVYSLTDAGSKVLIDPKSKTLCAGHYKVDEVVKFSAPGNRPTGQTMSEATYTFSPVDVAEWASNPAIKGAFPSLAKQLEPHQQARAVMVLMNDGWTAEVPPNIF